MHRRTLRWRRAYNRLWLHTFCIWCTLCQSVGEKKWLLERSEGRAQRRTRWGENKKWPDDFVLNKPLICSSTCCCNWWSCCSCNSFCCCASAASFCWIACCWRVCACWWYSVKIDFNPLLSNKSLVVKGRRVKGQFSFLDNQSTMALRSNESPV